MREREREGSGMITVGADAQKRVHAAVAVHAAGRLRQALAQANDMARVDGAVLFSYSAAATWR